MKKINIETLEEIQTQLSLIVKKSVENLSKHKKNVYISAPSKNNVDKALLDTVKLLQKKIKSPLYTLYYPMDNVALEESVKTKKNLTMLHNCDVFVALISNVTTEVASEIGLASALGKRIVLVGYDFDDFVHIPSTFLKYVKADRITLDKFGKFLQGSLSAKDFIQ